MTLIPRMLTDPTYIAATDERCQVCKSTKYLNPKMKILTSPCYHRMCDSCVERLFGHGASLCPFCKTTLRKTNFVSQTFEDLIVERECQIRKTIHKYMNKVEEDFPTLEAYNDYLELLEDYTFKLLKNQNVQQVYEELEQFRSANKDIIQKNVIKQMNEERVITQLIEKQNEERKRRHELDDQTELEDVKRKEQEQKLLIDEVTRSDQPASVILEKKRLMTPTSASLRPSSSRTVTTGSQHLIINHEITNIIDAKNTTGIFDPLETCYQFPIIINPKDVYVFDPALSGWIDRQDIRAGGCTSYWFHKKALQGSFLSLQEFITSIEH